MWRQNFTGTNSTYYSGIENFIALDAVGNVISASSVFSNESHEFTYVVKYDAGTGQKLWEKMLPSPSFAIEPLPNGDVRINQGNVWSSWSSVSGAVVSGDYYYYYNNLQPALPHRGGVPLVSSGVAYVELTSADGMVRRVAKYLNAAQPGAPTITSGFSANDIVSLSFLPPADDGGAPIIDYAMTCRDAATPSYSFTRTTLASPATSSLSFADPDYYWQSVTLQCSLRARNLFGYGDTSARKTFFAATTQFALIDAVSRKTHAASGNVDLVIARGIGAAGPVTVEPRIAGAGHLIVFQFNDRISGFNGLTATIGASPAVPATDVTIFDNERRVSLPAATVPDGSRVRISGNVANSLVTIAITESVGFLLGDADNSRVVDQTDVVASRARSGQRVSSGNFRFDINLSGVISASDILAIRGRKGRSLAN